MGPPGTPETVPHAIELCYGSRAHCHWHNVDEPAPDDACRVCLECNHVYRTAGDLLSAWAQAGVAFPDPEAVPGCAFCCHDW